MDFWAGPKERPRRDDDDDLILATTSSVHPFVFVLQGGGGARGRWIQRPGDEGMADIFLLVPLLHIIIILRAAAAWWRLPNPPGLYTLREAFPRPDVCATAEPDP